LTYVKSTLTEKDGESALRNLDLVARKSLLESKYVQDFMPRKSRGLTKR